MDPLRQLSTAHLPSACAGCVGTVDPLKKLQYVDPLAALKKLDGLDDRAKVEECKSDLVGIQAKKPKLSTRDLTDLFDDRYSVAIAFGGGMQGTSVNAASMLLQSMLPRLAKLCPDNQSPPGFRLAELAKPKNIKRSKDLVAITYLSKTQADVKALKAWDTTHDYVKRVSERLLVFFEPTPLKSMLVDPSMLLGQCVLIVDWMWDETHQVCRDGTPCRESFAALPLTAEYLRALKSGGYKAARHVAMSVMVQLGGFQLFDTAREQAIMTEDCAVPLARLRRLTAATLETVIQNSMPFHPVVPCALFTRVLRAYFLSQGDSASSNDVVQEYEQLAAVPGVSVFKDKRRCHKVNLCNHEQLAVTCLLNPAPVVETLVPVPAPPVAPRGRGHGRGRGGRGGPAQPVAKPKAKAKKASSFVMTSFVRAGNLFSIGKTWDFVEEGLRETVTAKTSLAHIDTVLSSDRHTAFAFNKQLLVDLGIIVCERHFTADGVSCKHDGGPLPHQTHNAYLLLDLVGYRSWALDGFVYYYAGNDMDGDAPPLQEHIAQRVSLLAVNTFCLHQPTKTAPARWTGVAGIAATLGSLQAFGNSLQTIVKRVKTQLKMHRTGEVDAGSIDEESSNKSAQENSKRWYAFGVFSEDLWQSLLGSYATVTLNRPLRDLLAFIFIHSESTGGMNVANFGRRYLIDPAELLRRRELHSSGECGFIEWCTGDVTGKALQDFADDMCGEQSCIDHIFEQCIVRLPLGDVVRNREQLHKALVFVCSVSFYT